MIELVKAKVEEERSIYIHNDLANAAFSFKQAIEEKQKNGGVGITHDCMACVTMLAFTWEAYLNFFGFKLIEGWDEKQKIEDKIDQVLGKLNITPDKSRRPYSSIILLMKLRNVFAHGKPQEKTVEKTVVNTAEKVTTREINLSGDWQKECTATNTLKAYEDLDTFWHEMTKASGMTYWDTMTKVEGGAEVIDIFDPTKPKA